MSNKEKILGVLVVYIEEILFIYILFCQGKENVK